MRRAVLSIVLTLILFSSYGFPDEGQAGANPQAAMLSVDHSSVRTLSPEDATPLAAGGDSWTYPYQTPSPRYRHAMAYDAWSDRVIMFGGDAYAVDGQTWSYDFNEQIWRDENPSSAPSPRSAHAMAYDTQSDRVILFGGVTETGESSGSTWAYNLETNSWKFMSPPSSPSGREGHAMAYDSQSDRVILFGGYTGTLNTETWAYDFESNTWQNMNPPTRPSARAAHAMAYDSQSDRVVLFGGDAGTLSNETWVYNLETNSWTLVNPLDRPSARYLHAMAYDSQSDRVLLFGGGSSEFDPSMWAHSVDTNTWTRMAWSPIGSEITGHAMTYVVEANRIIVFGGKAAGIYRDETWAYNFQADGWAKMPTNRPSGRYGHGMAYDSKSDRTILFGGSTGVPSDETWAYHLDVDFWEDMSPTGGPSARYRHAMAYDSQSDRVVLFGGDDGMLSDETWTYDYESNTWQKVNPTNRPPGRSSHAMAYDSQSDRVILFGGETGGFNDETWAYGLESNTWTNMSPTTRPPGLIGHAMVYDSVSDRVIFFGGYAPGGLTNETWAYDFESNTWNNLNPMSRPQARYDHAMAYDSQSGRVISFGGNAGGLSQATWAYILQSNTWQEMSPTTPPSYRASHAMAYDSQSDRTVLFGGEDVFGRNSETWWYEDPPNSPSFPRTIQAIRRNSQVDLSWQAPALDGGSPITGYRIYRGTSSGGESLLVEVGAVLAHVDAGLTNGVTYYYQVSAVNALGEGPRSSEVSATPANIPSAPRSLQASRGNSQVDLSWQAPAINGGSPISNYRVYRGTSSGGATFLVSVGNVLDYADTGVTNGVTYYYQVSAVNALGAGPLSNESSATPAGTATPPRSLQATHGDGQVNLSWQAPALDGGSPITGYRIYRGTSSGGESLLVEVGAVLAHVDAGLTNGVTYYYQVSAVNALGEGPRSSEVSATPTSTTVAQPTAELSPWIFVAVGLAGGAAVGAGIYLMGKWRSAAKGGPKREP